MKIDCFFQLIHDIFKQSLFYCFLYQLVDFLTFPAAVLSPNSMSMSSSSKLSFSYTPPLWMKYGFINQASKCTGLFSKLPLPINIALTPTSLSYQSFAAKNIIPISQPTNSSTLVLSFGVGCSCAVNFFSILRKMRFESYLMLWFMYSPTILWYVKHGSPITARKMFFEFKFLVCVPGISLQSSSQNLLEIKIASASRSSRTSTFTFSFTLRGLNFQEMVAV